MRAPDGGVLRCCTRLHFVALHQTCRKPNKVAICCTIALESVFLLIPLSWRPAPSHFSQSPSLNSIQTSTSHRFCKSVRVRTASYGQPASPFLPVSQFEQHPNERVASVCQSVRVRTASAPHVLI